MSENDNKSKTLGIRGGSGTVKQSFARGRSKQVVVETKKKRLVNVPGAKKADGSGQRNAATLKFGSF